MINYIKKIIIPLGLFVFLCVPCIPCQGDFFTSAIAKSLAAKQLQNKTIAISSVVMISGEENELCMLYKERITSDLLEHTSLVVVNRNNMDKALSEIALSLVETSSDEITLELGKMVNAQFLLDLIIAELKDGTEITAKVTEVETVCIVFSKTFRDFEKVNTKQSSDYNPEKELSEIEIDKNKDIKDIKDETIIDSPPQSRVIILKPTQNELKQKISKAYRKKNAQRLAENNALYKLRKKNPKLLKLIKEAQIKFHFLARRQDLFILFLFTNKNTSDYIKKNYPHKIKWLYTQNLKIKRNHPQKSKFVSQYIKKYGPLIRNDRNLKRMILFTINNKLSKRQLNTSPTHRKPPADKKRKKN